ncbi:LOW QUALITY PROTEIN: alpha-mannosidase 2C1-like [Uloborus diversus]|uniref:LOW QUALITY PROTEIN: alpha-mannosidase 2C1-like n=1 Tax=Uloborus diversus TaxID=327109 RepID=UPI002409C5ED|nr:LOW QUALITY PROTEIN: alpha-mannosidase 2C1-like [Uloborus diversus]
MASLTKNRRTTLERIEKFISHLYFTDINLYGRLYPQKTSLPTLLHFDSNGRVPFKEAMEIGNFTPTKVGSSFGPTWTTHWFKVRVDIPESWLGKEVHLRWHAGCESMLWTSDGIPLQGLNGTDRQSFIISCNTTLEDLRQTFYVEMACNTLLGSGSPTMISPPDRKRYFTLELADIAVFDRQVFDLVMDFEVLHGIAKHLPKESIRSYDALYAANEMINIIQKAEYSKDSYASAKEISKKFFSQSNGESQHKIIAVGNCHIDCAWLWPYEETVRKCARSWSSVVQLMERYPNFRFACSQAQQFMWVKENYPALYEKVKYFVAKGQFVPVGGTWVEMDGNLPGGESFVRQFLYGQRFFQQEFCKRCKEFWLPDTFGYSAQIPQIMKLCNIDKFLTTKLSWSLVNSFPHDNFLWEGIDGSSVIVHFPPAKTYTATVSVEEVIKTVENLQDKGRVSCSMMLYGHGDGGGGPTEEMIERVQRLCNVDGLPKVQHGTPDQFFRIIEDKHVKELCKWSGELYLELHNGTYTSQAKMKFLNRQCEILLRDTELLHSVLLAACRDEDKKAYPELELERLWKIMLLNQFHDVLPGSSIEDVHKEAAFYYKEVIKGAAGLMDTAVRRLFGVPEGRGEEEELVLVNVLSWNRTELIRVPWYKDEISRRMWIEGVGKAMQNISNEGGGGTLVPVVVGPMGYQLLRGLSAVKASVLVEQKKDGTFFLKNQFIEAIINQEGCVSSLILSECRKEAIAADSVGNRFLIYDDIPLYWDAWDVMDYHLETGRNAIKEIVEPLKIVEQGPLRASLLFRAKIGTNSEMKQKISIDAVHPYLLFETTICWEENHKFLKVEFPVNVFSKYATYEIQFGSIQRPTHANTSWDWAKYEVCAHKWVDLSEYDWGVAILNKNKYGHSVRENRMFLSLLRSPKCPDPKTDIGKHSITYAIMPHAKTYQQSGVIQQAYQLNCPIHIFPTSHLAKPGASHYVTNAHRVLPLEMHECLSWFQVSDPAIVIETVKKAEDRDDCLVVRMYESFGGRVHVVLKSCLPIHKAVLCNALEDVAESSNQKVKWKGNNLELSFLPYQIISVLLYVEV